MMPTVEPDSCRPMMIVGRTPGTIIQRCARNAARQIDHVSERKFGDRPCEPGPRTGHQHASGGRSLDIDVADVDRAADEGAEFRQLREHFRRSRRQSIGNDHLGIARGTNQTGDVERIISLVQRHLTQPLQSAQRPLAVILPPRLRGVGE